ncbi:MAG: polysaccharide deacetylase family protein [Polyangiaceae bacterium]|nr:polysaccharide deacetylase family protein [Polyangiaceae bacterium]
MLCSISVDLDEIPVYYAIHGWPAPERAAANAVYEVAIARFEAFARAHHLPLTFFAIGADALRPGNGERLRGLAAAGHELANHSLDHFYDLTRRGRAEVRRQIVEGAAAIERASGSRPVGFRAPGYTLSDELVEELVAAGVEYDSSVFPCPHYYLGKAIAIGAIRLRGRRSQSIITGPSVLAAPMRPYRLGRPYWRRGEGLVELPIQVTRRTRLPFIGTTLVAAGPWGARWITRDVVGEPFINLELHGIDVLDADDGLDDLVPHRLDLRVPVERKLEGLSVVVEALKHAGYRFVRMDEVAREIGAHAAAGAR